ncbi:MoaD/ThiS family protein [Pseudomonas sp. R5(2019)]|uniref:MoaD/ThiS family protein n=1 Tax=Pseudomonas sp. R5(2019) TaxID=2697566 RepID=UPI001412297F|nr:MoaD/ThiS family protein [Pseudomonas sp. R5(2019)]NBA98062.1 molybdopterin synthase sulfur carrier subunit [Pseudomonas sp. R5(2019)]
MKLKVLYFARYREAVGIDSEIVSGDFQTLDDLRQYLSLRHEVLTEQNLMCARNEELCQLAEPLADGDEVAFFPTVTGG